MTDDDLRKIWWLASYPKSGNTWIKLFLEAYVTGMPVQLNNGFARLTIPDNAPHYYQAVCPWPLPQATATLWAALRVPALLQAIASRGGEEVIMKTHHANVGVHGMCLIPSVLSLGAVYIVRDPRDIAVSWARHSNISIDDAIEFMGNNIATIGNEKVGYGHILQDWSTHVRSWTGKNESVSTSVIKYEHLVHDPHRIFTKLIPAIGFGNVIEERLNYAVLATSFETLQAKEKKSGFKEQKGEELFFRCGQVGAWKRHLTMSQAATIEKDHGAVMEELGYETGNGT